MVRKPVICPQLGERRVGTQEAAINASGGKYPSIKNLSQMFRECITWSDITTSSLAARYSPEGFLL